MRAEREWDRLITGLRGGDEHVVAEFCRDYGGRLQRLADRYIQPGLRRRMGPESVVQSACCSFLRRAREGQYQLADCEDLWRLLCAITVRKVREHARFHLRQKRGVDREIAGLDTSALGEAPGPLPDEAVAIAEEFERLLASLDEEDRRIVELKLQELSNLEVADALGCSERTVRRLLNRLRSRLEQAFVAA